MKTKIKKVDGYINFYFENGKIKYETEEHSESDDGYGFIANYELQNLMSGTNFVEAIEYGSITDSDGYISEIFVNDYLSNLGIWDYRLHQGKFYISLKDFKKLCEKYTIEINWVNR